MRTFKHDVHRSISSAMNQELDKRISNIVQFMGGDNYVFHTGQTDTKRGRRHNGKGRNYYNFQQIFTFDNSSDSSNIEIIVNDSIYRNQTWESLQYRPNRGNGGNLDIQKKKMDRIFLSIMNNMDSPNQIPGGEFNSDEFNLAFKKELQQLGIDLNYKLAVVGYNNTMIKNINGEFSKNELSEAIYYPIRHTVIPSANIAVMFPKKNMYILSKNAIMSLTSLILILLSISSIIYIINSFFSQKRISEIRRDFMNNMTHELKTPISTVGLALEAMQNFEILDNPERTEQYIDIARKENHRLGMLVEKVLKMSAYERENIQMKWEDIDGDAAVDEVINNLAFQVEGKGGAINKELEARSTSIKVDKVHFTNVIYNLLDNAMKYSDEVPNILVRTYSDNNFWYVDVKDDGVGIPINYQNKIFEKFFRVPSGNVHNVKGYGLGLSYVFNIINKFSGDISVKSDTNKGSVFTIKLPINNG